MSTKRKLHFFNITCPCDPGKHYMLFRCLVFSLFLFSCSSTRFPQQGRTGNVPEDFFGIVHAGPRASTEGYALLDDMGVKWTRGSHDWAAVERVKGNFDFSRYDRRDTAGLKVIATLAYSNPWLFPEGKSKRYIAPENIPHFLRYVEEMLEHFHGKGYVWNVWNEPNSPKFWRGPNKDYYELSRQTAQRIRELDPEAYILGGSFVRAPRRFIKRMNRAGAMENLDGLAFHPYAVNPAGSMRVTDKFFRIMSDINFTGAVWITEIGHPTGGKYPHRVSLEGLPSHVVRSMTGAAARDIRVLLWYQQFDRYNRGVVPPKEKNSSLFKWTSEQHFGLAYPDYTRKSGAWAYELCARYLPGSRYAPDFLQRENLPSSIASFCFLDGVSGNNTLVLWNDRKRSKKTKFYLEAPAVLYDITTGKGQALSGEIILEIGKQPMIITWQGKDVPRLSICK